jgi:RimJ/RimL family protein N-acetyltransferase
VATAAVRAVSAYGFATLGLQRMEATTFTRNMASQRVLEKAGFNYEGVLKGYHLKNDVLVDVRMYALVKTGEPR